MVKNPPLMEEMQIRSLGQEDPPGEGNGNPLPYSCWELPWTEEPGRLRAPLSMGSQKSQTWLSDSTAAAARKEK